LDEHKELDEEWFAKITTAWARAESLVEGNKVVSVGVADFELPALKALYERSNLKPCVDHYNIEGCCVVGFLRI
jgi:diketogulonate reductase-like aldo/keto reductase